ncbi:MAG: hypothetical protein EOO16_00290 [Chitinophagaceae bacterium]|nr:MAG: hypothetical protein EOO16_00290 [Chitinophagaceae bacterium]
MIEFLIILTIVVLTGLVAYSTITNAKKKKLQAREFWESILPELAICYERHVELLRFDNGYFSNHKMQRWLSEAEPIAMKVDNRPYKSVGLAEEDVNVIQSFLSAFKDIRESRIAYNKRFVDHEIKECATFFDTCIEVRLDDQQRTCIVSEEDNTLVIAGAGSGKTTTINGKVRYLKDRLSVDPSEMLLISFTRKSADDLRAKINIKGLDVKTFHKFSLDLIAETTQKKPTTFDETKFDNLIRKFLKQHSAEQAYLSKLIEFFVGYIKPIKEESEFQSKGDYIQYLKDQNFRPYKTITSSFNGKATIRREIVKSIEECQIANFLFFNGIDYEYEETYPHDTSTATFRQYKPDFTLKQGAKRVYVEHCAISSDGNVPPFFKKPDQTIEQATQVYKEKMEFARRTHREHSTVLIETFSHEMRAGTLFDNLRAKLEKNGIKFYPKSNEEILKVIQDQENNEYDGLISMIKTFISLFKGNDYSFEDLLKKNNDIDSPFFRKRNTMFIELVRPILDSYQTYLRDNKEVDFNDMINMAARLINGGNTKKTYRYVVVDEFQDISIGRYKLLKALKDANPECKLFCVGDDWQSIYRFSGSDISLFRDFEKYFGVTHKARIETTYRFAEPIISTTAKFILRNPNQEKKSLQSLKSRTSTQFEIIDSVSDNHNDDTNAIIAAFEQIMSKPDWQKKSVMVLGRYTFDIKRVKSRLGLNVNEADGAITYININSGEPLIGAFTTVHKAKGLEADIVIVLNCNAGKYGFPSEISDDPILNLLLSTADQYPNGEERRLFYVAMTRAKENVYLIADQAFRSKFILELMSSDPNRDTKNCPDCKNGILVRRTGSKSGKQWAFWGCSNYAFGCEFKEWENSRNSGNDFKFTRRPDFI